MLRMDVKKTSIKSNYQMQLGKVMVVCDRMKIHCIRYTVYCDITTDLEIAVA